MKDSQRTVGYRNEIGVAKIPNILYNVVGNLAIALAIIQHYFLA